MSAKLGIAETQSRFELESLKGSWSIIFSFAPGAEGEGATQCIVLDPLGRWRSPTHPTWSGAWSIKGRKITLQGASGTIATLGTGKLETGGMAMAGSFRHYDIFSGRNSTEGTWQAVRTGSCLNADPNLGEIMDSDPAVDE